MATHGIGYFNGKGEYFKTPEEATASDLAVLLGRVGDGEGLSLGIARVMLEKRGEIEAIFAAHDDIVCTVSGGPSDG